MRHVPQLLLWAAVPIGEDNNAEPPLRPNQLQPPSQNQLQAASQPAQHLQHLLQNQLTRAFLGDVSARQPAPSTSPQRRVNGNSRGVNPGAPCRRSVSVNLHDYSAFANRFNHHLPDILLTCAPESASARPPIYPATISACQRRRQRQTTGRKVCRLLRPSLPAPHCCQLGAPLCLGHTSAPRKISVSDTLRQVGRDLRRIADQLQIYKLLTRSDNSEEERTLFWISHLISGMIGCAVLWGFTAMVRRSMND